MEPQRDIFTDTFLISVSIGQSCDILLRTMNMTRKYFMTISELLFEKGENHEHIMTSDYIIRAAEDVEIINLSTRVREINEEIYLVTLADVAGSKGGVYRVLIFRSKHSGRDWSSCNCTGFMFKYRCKHLYAVEIKNHNAIMREKNDSTN